MALEEYCVDKDQFELDKDQERKFCFPCIMCIHRKKDQYAEPCNSCEHNVNAQNI